MEDIEIIPDIFQIYSRKHSECSKLCTNEVQANVICISLEQDHYKVTLSFN